MGKSGPNATLNLFFLGLGWPWVGEFVGFIIVFDMFNVGQNVVCRKHPTIGSRVVVLTWDVGPLRMSRRHFAVVRRWL